MKKLKLGIKGACLGLILIMLVACGERQLIIASSTQNEATMKQLRTPMMAEFEQENSGVKVKWDSSSGDDYQFAGLPAKLNSDTPPDIYFEWSGNRVAEHVKAGEALDISDIIQANPKLLPAALKGFTVDGKYYGVPETIDITIMIWYSKKIFQENNLSIPKTWKELLEVCKTLKAKGITAFQFGNSDLWTAGNFFALFFYRLAGEQAVYDVLSLKKDALFHQADFVRAMQQIRELQPYINSDANTLGYEESAAAMFNGKAAMYPMGSWYVGDLASKYLTDVNSVEHDFFNLPMFEGEKGTANSILGVSTGFIVNPKSKNLDLAKKFIAKMASEKWQSVNRDLGVITAFDFEPKAEALSQKTAAFLKSAGAVLAPPDTGFKVQVAESLYKAIAAGLDSKNTESVETILQMADQRVSSLR